MKEYQDHDSPLSPEVLRAYLDGKLSDQEQYAIEKRLLENPLEAEALEGLEQLDEQKWESTLNELQVAVDKRTQQKKRTIWPIWLGAAAASVCVFWFAWLLLSPNLAENETAPQFALEDIQEEPKSQRPMEKLEERPSDEPSLEKGEEIATQEKAVTKTNAQAPVSREESINETPEIATSVAEQTDVAIDNSTNGTELAVNDEQPSLTEPSEQSLENKESLAAKPSSSPALAQDLVESDDATTIQEAEESEYGFGDAATNITPKKAESARRKARLKKENAKEDLVDTKNLYDYYREENFTAALVLIKHALDRTPNDQALLFLAVKSYVELEDFKKAANYFKNIRPDTFRKLEYGKFKDLLKQKKKEEALSQLNKYVLVGRTLILRQK